MPVPKDNSEDISEFLNATPPPSEDFELTDDWEPLDTTEYDGAPINIHLRKLPNFKPKGRSAPIYTGLADPRTSLLRTFLLNRLEPGAFDEADEIQFARNVIDALIPLYLMAVTALILSFFCFLTLVYLLVKLL